MRNNKEVKQGDTREVGNMMVIAIDGVFPGMVKQR